MSALVPVNTQPAMTVSDVERVAFAIAKGGLFGSKDPNAVLTLCLLAQAEGQHPAVVFRDYHIISGKPAKKAEAMLRDFLAGGGKIEWHKLDDECADATFSHPAGGTVRIAWDMKRVQAAQLGSNAMYKKYPRQMLRSRTISEGVRSVYPGATSGLYVPEEVTSFELTANPETGEVIEAQAEKIAGIHKIKTAIRQMKEEGNAVADLDAFNIIVNMRTPEMLILDEAQHSWWTGRDADGNEFEGVPAWIARRRSELSGEDSQFSMLIASMKETETKQQLEDWLKMNWPLIEVLDDVDRRKFEMAKDFHESAIMEMDRAAS